MVGNSNTTLHSVDDTSSSALDLEPIAGRLGAVVHGIDLGEIAIGERPELVGAIDAALVQHKVLFFRAQHLEPVSHLQFARRFGPVTAAHPTVASLPGHPHVFELDAGRGRGPTCGTPT